MHLRRRVAIEALPELVWDAITDSSRAREWARGLRDYGFVSADWPREGAQATARYRLGPFRLKFHLTVTESLRGRALQITTRSILGPGLEVYSFSTAAGVTTIWYDLSDEPNFLGKLLNPLLVRKLEKQIDATMASLKSYCERHARKARTESS